VYDCVYGDFPAKNTVCIPYIRTNIMLWPTLFTNSVGEHTLTLDHFPAPSCLLPIAYCLLPIAYCLLPIAYCLLPIAYCLLPIAHCLLHIAHCLLLLHIVHCTLHIAHCTLHIAYCILHIAYCILHIAQLLPLADSPQLSPLLKALHSVCLPRTVV